MEPKTKTSLIYLIISKASIKLHALSLFIVDAGSSAYPWTFIIIILFFILFIIMEGSNGWKYLFRKFVIEKFQVGDLLLKRLYLSLVLLL